MITNGTLRKMFLLDMEPHERQKLFWLTATFFLVIAAYTILKELKDSMFVTFVGKEYLPMAKQIAMVVLIPMIFFYSKLVDSLRRYQLLAFYAVLYGVLGLVFTYLLGHPTIGLANTVADKYRFFGWIFYFFYEGYSPFMVSVFWAFANSVNNPQEAKNNYAVFVSGSKIGGMLTPALAWWLFEQRDACGVAIYSDVVVHQLLLGIASVIVLFIPVTLYFLIKRVPNRYLHGYEAAYRVEKKKEKQGTEKTGALAGLWILLKYPYVLGIYSIMYFYEVINVVLNYQRISIAQSAVKTVSGLSCILYQHVLIMHGVGFLISLFGTRALMQRLGERRCLLLIPISTGLLLLFFMMYNTLNILVFVFIVLRSINYAFSYPVRESLYIPTVKEMKFKAKSWIDAFGSKFAKSSGGIVNMIASGVGVPGTPVYVSFYSVFFFGIIGLWTLAAYWMGRRFDKVIANNEVVGQAEAEEDASQTLPNEANAK
ncbi:MAG: Npt1/Npt2 family nucleotide transporter [Candidatus Babeliales bacterium]